MNSPEFNESVGPMGITGSQAISILGGSSSRIASHLEWERKCAGRRSVCMTRKQRAEVLNLLMEKINKRNYILLDHQPSSGFFTDVFTIRIRNNAGLLWDVNLSGNCDLHILPKDSNRELWFEGLEWFVGPWFPHSFRLNKIVDCLRDQV